MDDKEWPIVHMVPGYEDLDYDPDALEDYPTELNGRDWDRYVDDYTESWISTSPAVTITTLYDQDEEEPSLPDTEAKNGSLITALALAKVRDDLNDKLSDAQRATLDEAIRRLDPEGNVRSVLKEIEDGWEDG